MADIDDLVSVHKVDKGVELKFSNNIPIEMVEAQVSSCEAATCTCCTPAFREKVESFSSEKTSDGIKVIIKGDITAEQVKENVLGCAPKLTK